MNIAKYKYDPRFFEYVNLSAQRSANLVVSHLHDVLRPKSVLDVGCGRGVWCVEWGAAGVTDVVGIDGDYVDLDRLVMPRQQFLAHDLTQPLDVGRRFDLVTSLEVGEHLPAAAADAFVDTLIRHSELVLFSAAVPGQGGEHHINEQPYDYWRCKFSVRGYRCFDFLRPRLQRERGIEPWYRYNTLLFVADREVGRLPQEIITTEVPATQPIPVVASLIWRTRVALLKWFPRSLVHGLARLKHRAVVSIKA